MPGQHALVVIDHGLIPVKVGLVQAKVLSLTVTALLFCLHILLHKQQQVSLLKRTKVTDAGPSGSPRSALVSQLNNLPNCKLNTDPGLQSWLWWNTHIERQRLTGAYTSCCK